MYGALVLREASDAALNSASTASWRLHIHPAHPDNYPSFYQPLPKGELFRLDLRSLHGLRSSAGLPRPRQGWVLPSPPAPSAPRVSFLGHGDRSTFTSTCSRLRKQKKATSLIIKRHLRLIGKPRGPWVCPPFSPRRPLVWGGVCNGLGKLYLNCPGWGALRALPASPPWTPGQRVSGKGVVVVSPTDALISSENCSEGPRGGADEPANQPAWSRSDYTYKAMKAPAVHRVQGWGRRAGLCRAVWEGAVHRTHCGVGRRREAHERQAAPPPALRRRPPRLCVLPPPRLPHGPPVLGAATPSLPLIWPRNRRVATAQREGEPDARGREGGGALGSSCGEGASLFLLQGRAWPPAVCTLPPHGATVRPLRWSARVFPPHSGNGGTLRFTPRLTKPQPGTTPLAGSRVTASPAPALTLPRSLFACGPSAVRGGRAAPRFRPAPGLGNHSAAYRPARSPRGSQALSEDGRALWRRSARAGRGTSYESRPLLIWKGAGLPATITSSHLRVCPSTGSFFLPASHLSRLTSTFSMRL